jgi:hypothetical protein
MKPRMNLRESRLALLSRSTVENSRISASGHRVGENFTGRGLQISLALLILPFLSAKLVAQQISPLQNWPTDDPNARQYQPDQQYSPQTQYGQAQYPQQYEPPQAGYAQQGYPQQQAYADPGQYTNRPYPQQGYSQAQGLNAEQLEQIVAPIALYPDNLLAQVLAASTYPAQVAAADQWLRMQGNAPAEQIVAGADAQTGWDPSVKALTEFPQVLAEMARNLQWTTDLGNAYYNQPQDVMQTVQVMRDRAEAAGNLQSTPQEQVTVDQGNIELAPADAQTVYVPSYNPWGVYGQPVSPYPGFSLLDSVTSFLGSSPIQFGLGIAMQAFSSTPWGWLGWGLDWLAHSVLFNNGDYFTHSGSVADWGFAHGGPRAYRGGWDRAGGRDGGGWDRGNPRPRPGFEHGFGQGFDHGQQGFGRTGERYGSGWNRDGYSHGYRSYDGGRSAQEAYNRMPQAIGRPEQYGGRSQFFEGRSQGYGDRFGAFGRPGYGSGTYGRQQGNNFGGRPYANPVYHSPESGLRGNLGGRTYGSNGGERGGGEYGGGQARSGGGGFHLFGHGHDSQGFSGSNRGFGGNSFSGHSSRGFGGFGGGGYKAPKAGHFGGGGGHFGGGGGHSGGGHSGGGHSGGGHSGGGGGHGHHH